jgi:hypothetical protein
MCDSNPLPYLYIQVEQADQVTTPRIFHKYESLMYICGVFKALRYANALNITAPNARFLNLGTRKSLCVNYTLQPFYPEYRLNVRLYLSQSCTQW